MMRDFGKTALLFASASVAALIGAAGAAAQVETILVTAQRREQTLQETPVAVSVVAGGDIERSQIRDIRDLQLLVPSLQVAQFSRPGVTEVSIRGIGSSGDNIGLEPSAAVFVDNVYLPRTGAAINDFLSVERVEVLRGPQSTLFGRNASAGVISFTTRAPEYEWGGEAELTVGNYDSRIARGTITGPILGDAAAFRLDANMNLRDGFIDNQLDGDVNDRDRWAVRGQLGFEPSSDIAVRLIAGYSNVDEDCCAAPFLVNLPQNELALTLLGATVLPADPYERVARFDGPVNTEIETSTFSGQVDWDFEGFTLTSVTAFSRYDDSSVLDADFTELALSAPRAVDNSYDAFTQEIRLASTAGERFDWQVGAFYYDQDLEYSQVRTYGADLRAFADLASGNAITDLEAALGAPTGTFLGEGQGLLGETFQVDTTSWSVFAQLDFHVTDRLTVSGGLRYSDEEKDLDADINIFDPFSELDFVEIGYQGAFAEAFFALTGLPPTDANIAANPGPAAQADAIASAASTDPAQNPLLGLTPLQFTPPSPSFTDSRSEDNLSGNFIVSFDLTDNFNIYGSYSRGYKAGGFNVDSSAARNNAFQFNEELVDAFELGVKAQLLESRLIVNAAVFDQSIQDFQANVFTGTSFVLDNAGEILVRGLEVDMVAQPNDRWLFTGGFTYLFNAEYEDYQNAPCDDLNQSSDCLINNTQDLTGRELTGAPNFTGNATATFFQPIGDTLEGYVRGEVFYTSDRNLGADLDPRKVQEGYALVNASMGVGADDGAWELQLWGRNLFDEDYLQGAFSSIGQPGSLNAYPGDPRTYGVTLRVRR